MKMLQIAPTVTALVAMSLAVSACSAGDAESNGLDVRLNLTDAAGVTDVGLPKYPGAKPYKDPGESSSAANVGFSAGSFGFKVVALELASADRPQKVAAFYREALSKYGPVLDCSDAASSSKRDSSESGKLTCDSHDPGSHEFVYKAGSDKNQHIVAIEPHGDGTKFSLVHLDLRDGSKR